MDNSTIEIKFGSSRDDYVFAFDCAKDLARMEDLDHLPSISIEEFYADGSQPNQQFKFLIAKDGGENAGIALFYYGYSTWRGKLMYLCDLVVKPAFRRQGIARKLIETLIELANADKVKVLWWHVLKKNSEAIALYNSFSATIDDETLSCKLDENILKQYQEN